MLDDVAHLGVLVGATDRSRVVALGTSDVFHDPTLLRTFWDTDGAHLDSGVQAHLYTRPGDSFVARVPAEPGAAELFVSALDANHAIWRDLTGVELASSASRVVLATGSDSIALPGTASSVQWHAGSLHDAVVAEWAAGGVAVLAFVLDEDLLTRLGVPADAELFRRARLQARLMDKNHAMSFLAGAGAACARTYPFEASAALSADLARLPPDRRYVVKPAGGAAGIGVFTAGGVGADRDTVVRHVAELWATGRMPARLQVQEFLEGPVSGASVWLDGRGGCEVLEVHDQLLDPAARFTGARWTREAQQAREPEVSEIGRAMSAALGVPMLVGLDLVDGVVLEVNPRVTGSAPIAHLLRRTGELEATAGRELRRIDLDTRMTISPEAIATGRVAEAAASVRTAFGTLVLPQGLNPFGSTRVVFVNDDEARSARAAFARLVG